MKILVDTNLFLDVLLDREGLAGESQRVLDWCGLHPGDGWVAWHTLANLYYIGAKSVGEKGALREIKAILEVFEVCPVDSPAARAACDLPVADFEDALQIAAAQKAGAESIVTRNKKDFKNSPVPAWLPGEFLKKIASGS